MGATLEIFAGVIRGGAQHQVLGDPYEWLVPVRSHPERIGVAVLGPAGDEPTKHRREIMACLAPHFERVRWVRRKSGKVTEREYDLTRYR